MKALKLFLWIFVLYVLQNIVCPIVSVTQLVPDLLLGFIVSYSALEHRFDKLSPVIIITALVAATGTGRVFSIVMLFVGLAGIVSYIFTGYLRFIPHFVRAQLVTLVFSFIMCISEFFVCARTLTGAFIFGTALPCTLFTTVASCIIYLLVRYMIFKNTEKKLLIAQERN